MSTLENHDRDKAQGERLLEALISDRRTHPSTQRADRLLHAIVSDRRTQETNDLLWLAAQEWLACGGQIAMNRFLGLPTTGAQLHRAVRDFWLRKAALLLTDGAELDIARLHQEFSTFITRGAWPSWRKLDLPPENASELRRALFFAAKFSDGETLCPRQMYRRLT